MRVRDAYSWCNGGCLARKEAVTLNHTADDPVGSEFVMETIPTPKSKRPFPKVGEQLPVEPPGDAKYEIALWRKASCPR